MSLLLNSDDRALNEMNNVSAGRSQPTLDLEQTTQRVRQLAAALQHFRVQALKDKLDCTYLESLDDHETGGKEPLSGDISTRTVDEVQQDLSSLYAEIDDVVTMTVHNEHSEPIEAAIRQMSSARDLEGAVVAGEVCIRICIATAFVLATGD